MKRFCGCLVAMVTPFTPTGAVDEAALRRLVRYLLEGGVDGLVPCGSTGEGATLTEEESVRVASIVLEEAQGRAVVIGGASSNDTRVAVRRAVAMARAGVDGILSVAPYYNKPTQEGMYQHFKAIVEEAGAPLVLYNVPGRTASNINPETVERLASLPGVVAIKEASGNLVQVMEIMARAPALSVLSGDDILTLPMMALGGHGVISVVGNEAPSLMAQLVRAASDGRWDLARELHFRLMPLMQANFLESNPIPVKAALAMMGLVEEAYRLPLVPASAKTKTELRRILEALGLLGA